MGKIRAHSHCNPGFLSETGKTMNGFWLLSFRNLQTPTPTLTVRFQHLSCDPDGEREVFGNDWPQSLLSQSPWKTPKQCTKDSWCKCGISRHRIQAEAVKGKQTMSKLSPVEPSYLSSLVGCVWRELLEKESLFQSTIWKQEESHIW